MRADVLRGEMFDNVQTLSQNQKRGRTYSTSTAGVLGSYLPGLGRVSLRLSESLGNTKCR